MGSLTYRDNQFIYAEQGMESVLIDCNDFLSNKSKVSMGRFESQTHPVIPELLSELIQKSKETTEHGMSVAMMDVLLASQLMKYAGAVRVLEYGSSNGQFSCHLAELISLFEEESSLVCVNHEIDFTWLERISQAERLPQLSFLAGDYGKLPLQKKNFDIVVINGMTDFPDTYRVISETLKLAKEDGTIICYAPASPLLEYTFQIVFGKQSEYEICAGQKIMVAHAKDNEWIKEQETDIDIQVGKDCQKVQEELAGGKLRRQYAAELVGTLQRDIKAACEMQRNDLKIQLLECKEKLISIQAADYFREQR